MVQGKPAVLPAPAPLPSGLVPEGNVRVKQRAQVMPMGEQSQHLQRESERVTLEQLALEEPLERVAAPTALQRARKTNKKLFEKKALTPPGKLQAQNEAGTELGVLPTPNQVEEGGAVLREPQHADADMADDNAAPHEGAIIGSFDVPMPSPSKTQLASPAWWTSRLDVIGTGTATESLTKLRAAGLPVEERSQPHTPVRRSSPAKRRSRRDTPSSSGSSDTPDSSSESRANKLRRSEEVAESVEPYPVGSKVFVKRSDGTETVAYVQSIDDNVYSLALLGEPNSGHPTRMTSTKTPSKRATAKMLRPADDDDRV